MVGQREDWVGLVNSATQFALAFTLVFLVHELGLVSSARGMGAQEAVLFHNNMSFHMTDPVQTLAFGIGPLSTLLLGLLAAGLFAALPDLAAAWRRFLLWLAIHGAIMFLGQAPAVAHGPEGDLARAVYYFEWPQLGNRLFAIAGLLGLVGAGFLLGRAFLSTLAPSAVDLASRSSRLRWLAVAILLPGLVGALLCVPFRVPPLERAALPFTTVIGTGWALLAALPAAPRRRRAPAEETRLAWEWLAVLAALFVAVRVVLVPGLPIG